MVSDEERHSDRQVSFSFKEVDRITKTMTRGKSPGHDGLSIEHFLHAGAHLPRVPKMLFNLCISHCYLPNNLMKTIVVPIVKNKTGDVSDKSNYRPLSLATVVAKVLDELLGGVLKKHIIIQEEFGFKPNLSTESAIFA
ncbi:uncharacterized protein LOC113236665 [Hyposmocoma kahamanoa]|uniref:uncharacterized protein LOC113236665 n=1 Tax=Hyposmocoma kahamanoa TaxID=1477025 RepID=UPI000E6D8206|nr:uncharacterized protein LOC113236665 [Hyposmocoma kahamanoa]